MQLLRLLFKLVVLILVLSIGIASASDQPSPVNAQQALINDASTIQNSLPQLRQQIIESINQEDASQQSVSNQMDDLQQQNQVLQERINQLSQQLADAQAQLAQHNSYLTSSSTTLLQNTPDISSSDPTSNAMQQTNSPNQLQPEVSSKHPLSMKLLIGLVILAALLVIWAFWKTPGTQMPEKKATEQPLAHSDVNENKELDAEYDFMNTDEAIPVKLDVARAYVDMGDYDAAQEVLQAVFTRGTPAQQEQARALLNNVKMI